MSILQFFRILWARRFLTLATTIVTVIGAFIAILIVPPSYEAHSRVMLNTLKPDPVTGEILPTTGSRTYIATQIELIKDYTVAGEAVDQLGWASDPENIRAYQAAGNQSVDIRRWLSQRIIDHTDVRALVGTNILEISYKATTPTNAKAMADALRNAYLDSALQTRRRDATRTADWYAQQATQEQAALNAAEMTKTKFEKDNGIVMQDDNTDLDTARLRALSGQSTVAAPVIAPPPPTVSAAAIQLAQIDAAIAQASQNLGPNHPQMIEMKARRAMLAQVAAQDAAANRAAASAASRAAGATAGAVEAAVRNQTSRVLAQRDKIERLSQLQTEVNLRREQYTKSLARIAELRKEAGVADTGITSLGDAATPQKPEFPNKPLILGGSLGLGFALGILLSLLLELFARRVRSAEDLQNSLDLPLLAILGGKESSTTSGLDGLLPPSLRWPGRRRLAKPDPRSAHAT